MELKENERIDDLQRHGYRIIQNRNKFCFGMDAVLLSGFVCESEHRKDLQIADLGTGTGIIPLLLHARLSSSGENREDAGGKMQITGLEIQKDMQEMAERSVRLNGLSEDIRILHADAGKASALLGKGCMDVVTSNPPYMKKGSGLYNPDDSKAISRHEILMNFEDVAREASSLLKPGGRFYLVHRPERLTELIITLRAHHLEPKRLRMVHSFADSQAAMVLMETAKGGGTFLKVEHPLIIYKEKGVYTDEIREIYYY